MHGMAAAVQAERQRFCLLTAPCPSLQSATRILSGSSKLWIRRGNCSAFARRLYFIFIGRSYNWQRMSKIYTKTLGGGHRGVDAEELLWNVRGMV